MALQSMQVKDQSVFSTKPRSSATLRHRATWYGGQKKGERKRRKKCFYCTALKLPATLYCTAGLR